MWEEKLSALWKKRQVKLDSCMNLTSVFTRPESDASLLLMDA